MMLMMNHDPNPTTTNQKPASCLKDCIVGPSEEERKKGSPSWGDGDNSTTTTGKRKRQCTPDSVHTNTNNDSAATVSTLEQAIQTFLSSGCCIIPNVLPQEFVQICLEKATSDYELLNRQLAEARSAVSDAHSIANAYRVDYREMVDRDGGRRDVRFDLGNYPYTAPGLIYNSCVMPLIQKLLGGNTQTTGSGTTTTTTNITSAATAINLLYMGVMWARPSSEGVTAPQKWHADGGHLFDHIHLPPHCINVFFPLIDVESEHGPTEVQPGSHILGNFSSSGGDQSSSSSSSSPTTLGLEAKAGSAVLFDYRLKHRGGLNTSKQPRPILYLAYAKPWFRDSGNTRSGRSIFLNNPTCGNSSSVRSRSKPWVSRLLTGRAMPMGIGFDPVVSTGSDGGTTDSNTATTSDCNAVGLEHPQEQEQQQEREEQQQQEQEQEQQASGSGERWILFKMNVQLDGVDSEGNPREETIVVHSGDVAVEVATQFCLEHQLTNDFIPVLTETIQQQINQIRQS